LIPFPLGVIVLALNIPSGSLVHYLPRMHMTKDLFDAVNRFDALPEATMRDFKSLGLNDRIPHISARDTVAFR
jgi:hypothetical protein